MCVNSTNILFTRMSRHWSITLNNWFEEDLKIITDKYKDQKCLTIGFEVGKCGTKHLQCALSTRNVTSFNAIRKKLKTTRWHIEMMSPKSSPRALHSYCMKGESPKDDKVWKHDNPGHNWDGCFFGEFPAGQGCDPTIDDFADLIKAGEKTADEVCMEITQHQVMQYSRSLQLVHRIALRKRYRTWMTKGYWYHGGAGVGKSHQAFETQFGPWDPERMYRCNNRDLKHGFWDGYAGQEIIIINEFRATMAFGDLMDLVDKWPMDVAIKGSEKVPFLGKHVVITGPKKSG